jgi:hypothetical protein
MEKVKKYFKGGTSKLAPIPNVGMKPAEPKKLPGTINKEAQKMLEELEK